MVLTSVLDSSVSSDIRSSLLDHFMQETAVDLLHTLGVIDYLNDTSNNLTRGALDALPLLLLHATPSINLLAALKQPFNNEILSRTPPSLGKALHSIHDYLMVCAPTSTVHVDATHLVNQHHDSEYRKGEYTVLPGQSEIGEDEPQDFEVFLHRKGSQLPWCIMVH